MRISPEPAKIQRIFTTCVKVCLGLLGAGLACLAVGFFLIQVVFTHNGESMLGYLLVPAIALLAAAAATGLPPLFLYFALPRESRRTALARIGLGLSVAMAVFWIWLLVINL